MTSLFSVYFLVLGYWAVTRVTATNGVFDVAMRVAPGGKAAHGSAPTNSAPSWLRPAGTATAPSSPHPAPAARHPSDRRTKRKPSPAVLSCAKVVRIRIQ